MLFNFFTNYYLEYEVTDILYIASFQHNALSCTICITTRALWNSLYNASINPAISDHYDTKCTNVLQRYATNR